MGFTIPNGSGLTYPDQAAPDQRDFDILTAGVAGCCVSSGCAVTASGSDLVLTVASGVVMVAGIAYAVAGNSPTVTTAHATNPRYDLVILDSSGVASIIAGTAAAAPVFPSFNPLTQVVLAAVYVPANATTLSSANLVDKRFIIANTNELGYAQRTTDATTTNTSYSSSTSNKISSLSVTVIGEGLPVYIEFYCDSAYHGTATSVVTATLIINGSLTGGTLVSTINGESLTLRHRKILTAGTSYTFEIGIYGQTAGTSTFSAFGDGPMHLAVSR